MRKTGADAIYGGCIRRDQDGEIYSHVNGQSGDILQSLLRRESYVFFQGLLVKKEKLEQIELLNEQIHAYQEWDTAIRLAQALEFCCVGEPVFICDCKI